MIPPDLNIVKYLFKSCKETYVSIMLQYDKRRRKISGNVELFNHNDIIFNTIPKPVMHPY